MASIHKRPDSKYWHAAFRGPDGKLILRSTKNTDRQAALAVALEYQRAAKLAQRGELVEAQAREVLNDIMKRADVGEAITTTTVREHFKGWMAGKKAKRSEGTAERYRGTAELFLKHLGARADKPLTTLKASDVESFMVSRAGAEVSPTTIRLDVKIVSTALNAARRQGLITKNPAEAVELPERASVERGTFTPAEIKMLVQAAEGEWKTLILLGAFTGARLGDCCRMQWADVSFSDETITYTAAKTGVAIAVPIHPDLLAHLNQLAKSDTAQQFISPAMAHLKPGGRHGLSEGFKRIVRRAGLSLQTVKGGGKRSISKRTFHALRHTFTSALANAGVAQELRMKLTGHKSEAEHAKYSHHELETLRKAVKSIASLPE